MLGTWWVWVAFGLAVATLEVVVPGYVFVGFAIGAVLTGAAIGLGLPGGAWMAAAPLNAVVVFAVLSVVAWLSLRYGLGLRKGQVKHIRRDINED
ncbi:MAG: NfeD family protein [Pararhodobacter sp.]